MAVMPPVKPVSPTLRGGCGKEVPDVWPGLYKLLGGPREAGGLSRAWDPPGAWCLCHVWSPGSDQRCISLGSLRSLLVLGRLVPRFVSFLPVELFLPVSSVLHPRARIIRALYSRMSLPCVELCALGSPGPSVSRPAVSFSPSLSEDVAGRGLCPQQRVI